MKKFLALLAIAAASGPANGQESVGRLNQPIVVEGNVAVKNLSDSTRVSFGLRERSRGGAWQKLALEPGQAQDFRCGRSCDFSIRTGDQAPIRYGLEAKGRYAIYWDDDKGAWDLAAASD